MGPYWSSAVIHPFGGQPDRTQDRSLYLLGSALDLVAAMSADHAGMRRSDRVQTSWMPIRPFLNRSGK